MSRSKKKTPIHGLAVCDSEKADKRRWHRAFRRASRSKSDRGEFDDIRNFSDIWCMGKDGKHYWPDNVELMRK